MNVTTKVIQLQNKLGKQITTDLINEIYEELYYSELLLCVDCIRVNNDTEFPLECFDRDGEISRTFETQEELDTFLKKNENNIEAIFECFEIYTWYIPTTEWIHLRHIDLMGIYPKFGQLIVEQVWGQTSVVTQVSNPYYKSTKEHVQTLHPYCRVIKHLLF